MREREYRSRPHVKEARSNLTKAEVRVWARLKSLRKAGYRFHRQHPVDDFILDFANLEYRLTIEIDGATHAEDHEIDRDIVRTAKLEKLGWKIVRFTNSEVFRNADAVIDGILQLLPPSVRYAATSPACGGGD